MNSFHPQAVIQVNPAISISGTSTEVSLSPGVIADSGFPNTAEVAAGFHGEENIVVDAALYVVDEKAGIPCDGKVGFGVGAIRRSAHFSSHSPAFSPWVSKQLPRVAPKLTT